MVLILDGKTLKEKLLEEIKVEVSEATKKYGRKPGLATLIGEDDASKMYVGMKIKACERVGIYSLNVEISTDKSVEDIKSEIIKLNEDSKIDGILLQLPLPKKFKENTNEILKIISGEKDVDGLTPNSMGLIMMGDETFGTATPKGMIRLLERYNVDIKGKEVVIVNRTTVIGKPLMMMFIKRHGTVTVCHTKTADIDFHLKRADILVSGAGVVNFITADKVKEGVVILDAGINRNSEGKLCGDVDFEGVKNKCSAITPVPGGIGPTTIAMLLENTLLSFIQRQEGK